MRTLCARKSTHHPGHYFYKCPYDLNHDRAFLWCNEYHRQDPSGIIPDFVLHQKWKKKSVTLNKSHSDESGTSPTKVTSNMRLRSELEHIVALVFMAAVIFMFGIVFGRLI